jgi:adenosylcobinamide-phosphate synthase
MAAPLTLLALLFEIMVGYPDRLLGMVGHPVTWIGALIGALDRGLNRDSATPSARRMAGTITVMILITAVGTIAYLFERGLLVLPFGSVAAALLASTLLAQRSLHEHVGRVAAALEEAGIAAGRQYRISWAATPNRSTRRASRGPRSKAWRRISPTAWWRRPCGW